MTVIQSAEKCILEAGKAIIDDRQFDEVKGLMENDYDEDAERVLDPLLQNDHSSFRYLITKARLERRLGRLNSAEKILESIKNRDKSGIVTLEYGHLYMSKSKALQAIDLNGQAIIFIDKAIECYSLLMGTNKDSIACVELGKAYTEKGKIFKRFNRAEESNSLFEKARATLIPVLSDRTLTNASALIASAGLEKAEGNLDYAFKIFYEVSQMTNIKEKARRIAWGEMAKITLDKQKAKEGIEDDYYDQEALEALIMQYSMKCLIERFGKNMVIS